MSFQAVCFARTVTLNSGTEKAVFLALASAAHPVTAEAWPSLTTLADWASCTVPTVSRVLKKLRELGLISRAVSPDGVKCHAYRVHVPAGFLRSWDDGGAA